MNIIVFSDSHGSSATMEEIVRARLRDTDLFVHLGDGAFEFQRLAERYPERAFLCVCGNCDSRSRWQEGAAPPDDDLITLEGKRIFMTHGHRYGVKYGLETLFSAARERNADITLYGHTHLAFSQYLPETDWHPAMYFLCPGSISHPAEGGPSYGVIHIGPDGVDVHYAEW